MVGSRPCLVGLLVAAALALAPVASAAPSTSDGRASGAEAQPSAAELASARRLFAQAIEAEDRGRWAEALEMYERVSRVAMSPSLRYHTAVCHEALGHLVEALNAFELAASGAAARGERALAKESRARLDKLRGKTAQLTIDVPDDAEELTIEIDGEPINPALAGSALIIPPGAHRVVVGARNYGEVFGATVLAAAGGAAAVQADLGARKGTSALPRSAPPAPPAPPAPSRTPAFAVGGAALALAAGAVATGVAAYSVREDYLRMNEHPTPGSFEERQSLRDQGQALAVASTALTGGAVLAGAVATYLFWPSSTHDPALPAPSRPAAGGATRSRGPSARIMPWVGPEGGGIGIGGAL